MGCWLGCTGCRNSKACDCFIFFLLANLTMILQKICITMKLPVVYDQNGEKVGVVISVSNNAGDSSPVGEG
jgi:hypothetical protein